MAKVHRGGGKMKCLQPHLKKFLLAFTMGAVLLIWSGAQAADEKSDPSEQYKGVREATLRYIALGTPDDLLRLREAFDKTGQEIARLKLAVPPEKEEEFATKQKRLKDLRDRLAESQALLQLLESSSTEVSRKQLNQVYAKEREQLRKELSSRNDELKRTIADLEKEIRSGQVQYLQTLEEERKALARLIAVRREWLLAEYQSLSGCPTEDRSCVARKLKILCRLNPLFPTGSRAPIVTMLQDVSDQLQLGGGTTSSLCDYLSHDFGS
jgi:hypothetical protein